MFSCSLGIVFGINKKYEYIMKNQVWEVVPRPQGKKVVGSKWIYKVKHAADGSMEKYKACFVAKGFSQKEGMYADCIEVFTGSSKHLEHGTRGLTAIYGRWDFNEVRLTTTCTS